MKQKDAISKINKKGSLLVFPINNKKEPASLWHEFFPRSKMKWEWDREGDGRVSDLWALMKNLSDSHQVVYSKWYQGRATFFSKELFVALLCLSKPYFEDHSRLSRTARDLLDTLVGDSPLSTKQLKKLTGLQGKDNERFYSRGMRELFTHFLIVAFGEVDDGAFPSLAVGTTQNLFEELLIKSHQMTATEAMCIIEKYWPDDENLFKKYLHKHG